MLLWVNNNLTYMRYNAADPLPSRISALEIDQVGDLFHKNISHIRMGPKGFLVNPLQCLGQ